MRSLNPAMPQSCYGRVRKRIGSERKDHESSVLYTQSKKQDGWGSYLKTYG